MAEVFGPLVLGGHVGGDGGFELGVAGFAGGYEVVAGCEHSGSVLAIDCDELRGCALCRGFTGEWAASDLPPNSRWKVYLLRQRGLGRILLRSRTLGNRVEDFFDGLRMQCDPGVKGNDDPSCSSKVDSVAALGSKPQETGAEEQRLRFLSS